MSIADVQARTAELAQRLASLQPRPVDRAGTQALGGAATTFQAALQAAAPASTQATRSEAGTVPAWASGALGQLSRAMTTAGTAPYGLGALAPGAASTPTGTIPTGTPTGTTPTGADAVRLARQHLGTPYVWGGNTPAGFDCSGLLQYVYGKLGIDLPRVSRDQAKAGREVTAAEARPGDIVFFERPAPRPDHIGIYAGDGTWVVAPKTGDVVKVQKIDLNEATTIRRVIPEPASGAVARSGAGQPAWAPAAASAAPVPDWAAALPPAARPHLDALQRAATSTGMDPRLLAAVAWQESGFKADARSPVGAQGLMQIMPATARGLGVDALDPAQALEGGGRYLAEQMERFGGRLDLALAAYNAGPGAVRKYGGIPPYEETRNYVTTVLDRFRTLGGRA